MMEMDFLNALQEILSIPVIVSLLTLVVSLYLSYVLTIRRERKLRAIERHSNDLRDLGKRWIEAVPFVPPAKNARDYELSFEEISIEKEYLFSDIKNHIPSDMNLLELWEKFKKDLNEYCKKPFSLFQEILEDCRERTELQYNPDFTKGYGFSTHFVTEIYSDIFRVIEEHEPHFLKVQTRIDKKDNGYELWTSGYGIAQGSEEEMKKATKVREEFLNELQTSKYIPKARDLIKEQDSLEKEKDLLLRKINDFISIPLYRGECKYVKWSL
jgi:hypothetical protein